MFQLVGEGKDTKEIAAVPNVSVNTVGSHKARRMDKLDLHSTSTLTKCAFAEDLVNAESGCSEPSLVLVSFCSSSRHFPSSLATPDSVYLYLC